MPSMTLPSGGMLAYRDVDSGAPLMLIHGSPVDPVLLRALQLVHDKVVLDWAERFFTSYADRVICGETTAVGEMFDY